VSNLLRATLAIRSHDSIGEGPTWDQAGQRLLWSDNGSGIIHEATSRGARGWQESRRWAVGRPVAVALPRASGGLIVVGGTEAYFLDDAGGIEPFVRIDADPSHVKFNEGKCDPRGRLWAGTRDIDFSVPGRRITPGRGALYRIDPDGTVTTVLEDISLANGLDWSPDGKTLYFIDTYSRAIDAFDFDMDHGTLSGRRTVVRIRSGEGLPDGMTIDRDGNLWVAVAGAGHIRRYSADGVLLTRVDVPTPTVTSCAFGGLSGQDLFITSSRVQLPVGALTDLTHGFSTETEDSDTDPVAGGLFVGRPGVAGMPAYAFAG
jgi:sugar lactone lactonase YvrE